MATSLTLADWLQERYENCMRLATYRPDGADRDGWLEDGRYFDAAKRLEESHANLLTALDECDKYNSSDVTYNQSMFAASIRKIIAAAKEIK